MANLIAEISKLSILERIQLVQEILATISSEARNSEDFQLTKSQILEMESRSESLKNGTAKSVSWDSIESKLTARYGL